MATKFFLSDSRIALSAVETSDITSQLVGWLTDTEVVAYSQQRYRQHSIATCLAYLDSFTHTENLYLKIALAPKGEFIGTMSVYFDGENASADIGILIGEKSVWGKGIGYAAWRALMNHLLDMPNVEMVTGGCDIRNLGMLSLFKKLGMTEFSRETSGYSCSKYVVARFRTSQKVNPN